MKKKFLMLLALPALLLASCGNNNQTSTYDPWGDDNQDTAEDPWGGDDPWGDDGDDGGGMFGKDKVKVYFYISAAYTDPAHPFATQEVEVGGKITKPSTDPINPDNAFTTFVGWSKHPLIMSNDQLWDFANDTLPEFVSSGDYRLYGIWE